MNKIFKRLLSISLCVCIITASFLCSSTTADAKAPSKNIVVVLDPGHDMTHTGCQFAGLDEGIINLYIAYSCMTELQKYQGVTVYMTRYGFGCPFCLDANHTSDCLSARVAFAQSVHADIYVALHNDYDSDYSVCGAKVIYQNLNYRPDLAISSFSAGASILNSLTTTGLTVNNWKLDPNGTGMVTRNASVDTYIDGSVKDYYAVLNKTKTAGIPGMIVEHAFMSNKSDRLNHLSTPEQLAALGIADAKGIANYYGLKLK